MYRGVRYRVSCEDLGAMVYTKEGSAKLANAWWERKRAELDGDPDRVAKVKEILAGEDPHSRDIREAVAAWNERNRILRDLLDRLSEDKGQAMVESLLAQARAMTGRESVSLADAVEMAAKAVAAGDAAMEAGIARMPEIDAVPRTASPVPQDRTLKALADTWSRDRADEARTGARSAQGSNILRIAVGHFVAFVGPEKAADAITADLWQRWYVHCRGSKEWSLSYSRHLFTVARSFVKSLWESKALDELPRNLHGKRHRFEAEEKAPPSFSNEEIHRFLDAASGEHRLHLLLMLNCGMTQRDISDLRKDEIDLDAGTITRRRSKTRKRGAPLVSYPLWPETLALLREHLSADPVLALTTSSGRSWVRETMSADGKVTRKDSIANRFARLREQLGIKGAGKSLKVFRKTSATRLKSSKDYRDLRFFFLGHSARTVADRHYAAESQALLAEAVAWLGRQYGLTT
jgi:integrase